MKATVIFEKKGTVCYNAYGEKFFIDELYELKTPFYACYSEFSDERHIIGAFQEKYDLIQWMTAPLFRNHKRDDS
jgi:hypothetical protein